MTVDPLNGDSEPSEPSEPKTPRHLRPIIGWLSSIQIVVVSAVVILGAVTSLVVKLTHDFGLGSTSAGTPSSPAVNRTGSGQKIDPTPTSSDSDVPPLPAPSTAPDIPITIDPGQRIPMCGIVRGRGTIPPGMVLRVVVGNGPYFPLDPAIPDGSGGWTASGLILGVRTTPDGSVYPVQALLLTPEQSTALTNASQNKYFQVATLPKATQKSPPSELLRYGDTC